MWLVVTHFMMNNKNIELNKQLHKKILFLLFFEWINGTFLVYFFLIPALLFSITGLKKSFILKRTQVNFKVAHFFLSFSLSLSRLQFTWVYWGFQVSCKKKKLFLPHNATYMYMFFVFRFKDQFRYSMKVSFNMENTKVFTWTMIYDRWCMCLKKDWKHFGTVKNS